MPPPSRAPAPRIPHCLHHPAQEEDDAGRRPAETQASPAAVTHPGQGGRECDAAQAWFQALC